MTAAPVTVTMDRAAAEVDRSLERGHILALDGLRGIAILLVVFSHFVSNLQLTANGIAYVPIALAHAGWAGVDLFFVLSGFLITGILVDARGSPYYFKAFYARRALRILPAYYGFLLVIFVVMPLLNVNVGSNSMLARQHQGWYWLHLTNVMMALGEIPGKGPYPQTLFWSLAVEEQFYFLWPAVVALCSPKTLKTVCVAGLVGCIILRIAGTLAGMTGLAVSVLPFTRGDTLFAGALLAIEYRRGGLARFIGAARVAAVAAALMLVGLLVVYGQLDYHDAGTAMFASVAIMLLGASAVVLGTSRESAFARALRSGFLRFFGRYSYAIYIVHTAVLAALDRYRPFSGLPTLGGFALPAQTAWFLAYAGASTGLAFLSWHVVEKHFLRLKRLFPYRPRPAYR
jgi:peptidoglycan/LPS O-acetylase OafA/YrhL